MGSSAIVESGYWPARKRRQLSPHRNNGLELVLIVHGNLTWQVEGHVEPVRPGSVFFTFPWETHGSVREHEPGCELYFVVIRLDRDYPRPSRTFAFAPRIGITGKLHRTCRDKLLSTPRRSCPATPRLAMLMPQLIAETRRSDGSPEAIDSFVRLVLIELLRSIENRPTTRPEMPAVHRVEQFIGRLPQECHRPWTLATMADACNLGRSRFSDILKQITGDSPVMALSRARIDRAKELLKRTARPITHIAMDCGFTSSQHFASVFRDYAGMSARDFRRR